VGGIGGLLTPNAPWSTNGVDLQINAKQYPGIILNPISSEVGGQYQAMREINGAQWFLTNADVTTAGFFLINPALPAYAFVRLTNGEIATYSAPANSAQGFSWTLLWQNTSAVSSQGLFNVVNYGAVGNSTTDDSVAILDAYAAASAFANANPNNNACVVFPPLRFGYANATPISPAENVSTFAYPGAEINRLTTATDCFLFQNLIEIGGSFPNVSNFTTGAAFHFLNSSYCRISIQGCSNNSYGVLFDAANGSCNYNNIVMANEIAGNDESTSGQTNYGVAFRALVSTDSVAANYVNVGAIFECYACVAFLTSSVTPITAFIGGNTVNAGIITSVGLNGPASGNYGILCGANVAPSGNTIITGFLGYNATADVEWTSSATNNVVKAYIQSAGSLTYAKYAMGSYGNVILPFNPIYSGGSAIAASATANNRGGWNGGTATSAQFILSSATITSLAAGAAISFYVYSPFVNGSTPISVSLVSSTNAAIPLTIIASDNSGTNANEIKITFTNAGSSAITSTINFLVRIAA
jgi:hypothetical protein